MILEKETAKFTGFTTDSYLTMNQLLRILKDESEFKAELIRVFNIDQTGLEIVKIGNSKQLINALRILDEQCEKLDISAEMRNVALDTMLDDEKAIFEIFEISNERILALNESDLLYVESRYSAKNDLLGYYDLNKFANYCRDKNYGDLLLHIKEYLGVKNAENHEERSLRLVYKKDEKKFFMRAITSTRAYSDFGINFSVFVALISLNKYSLSSDREIFINDFSVNDSMLYVSFALKNEVPIDQNLSLSFNLILQNDEIKRHSVSFNGVFKLKYRKEQRTDEISLKPKGIKKDDTNRPVDLLTYKHQGKISQVLERLESLPKLIDFFIEQASSEAKKVSSITAPDDIRKLLSHKVRNSRKIEFRKYRHEVFNKLMSISVDNTFKLFELLRTVEELFEHDDIVSRDFWREKLYEALINGE